MLFHSIHRELEIDSNKGNIVPRVLTKSINGSIQSAVYISVTIAFLFITNVCKFFFFFFNSYTFDIIQNIISCHQGSNVRDTILNTFSIKCLYVFNFIPCKIEKNIFEKILIFGKLKRQKSKILKNVVSAIM